MKIVVIGNNSFIGINLVKFYQNHSLLTLGREKNLLDKIIEFQPDIIINCAAEIYDENKMWESNILLLKQLLEYCKKSKCKLIHFGSSSEYGRKNHSIKETDFLDPITMYESTKGMGTLLCSHYSRKYKFYCTVIRPFTIVGRYEKPHKFFPTLYRSWKYNTPINLSEGAHDFVFIDDFINIVDKIINYSEKDYFNIINVGSGTQLTNKEIVELFGKVLNYTYIINNVNKLREFDSMCWVCDNTLLKNKYEITSFCSPLEGISNFINDCKKLNLYEY
jgi:nucleoside-diphosphate-sugar epimerase